MQTCGFSDRRTSGKVRRTTNGEQGFTLMEMVVAVFIVSVMMASVAPHLLGIGDRAEKAACEQNQRMIRAALTEYYMMNNAYPEGDADTQLQELVDAELLQSVPKDPGGGSYTIQDTDPANVVVSCTKDGTLGASS